MEGFHYKSLISAEKKETKRRKERPGGGRTKIRLTESGKTVAGFHQIDTDKKEKAVRMRWRRSPSPESFG